MSTDSVISLQRIKRNTAMIEVRGTAPLICHAWSEKSRKEMLDKTQGRKKVKEPKDPQAEFEAARYRFVDGGGDGFPVDGFKKAVVVGGGRIFGRSVKMTELRQNLLFVADGLSTEGQQLTALISDPPEMREDYVRVGIGGTDLRYRPMFREWAAILRIDYIDGMMDLNSIVALVEAGGTNGIGDWRPERSGTFGTFEVVGA